MRLCRCLDGLTVLKMFRVKDIKSVIHVNKAACYDKEGRTEDVVNECNKALDLRGSNVKALFRRGRAYIGQGK